MSAREAILKRLKQRSGGELAALERDYSVLQRPDWSREEKLDRFQRAIESVHGKVHRTTEAQWVDRLADLLAEKGSRNLLTPKQHPVGQALKQTTPGRLPPLVNYDRPVTEWQAELFNDVDASITSTRGAIAETGSLILWPSTDEPRLMSLVPPLHIAVLYADELYGTFQEAMQAQNWPAGMPSNALLISGPSKTADIEQTLAYGVHGPRELLVLVIE